MIKISFQILAQFYLYFQGFGIQGSLILLADP